MNDKKTFTLNGKCKISFSPDDKEFADKLFRLLAALDHAQDDLVSFLDKRHGAAAYDKQKACDSEMRKLIDEALGGSVCASLFGGMQVYAKSAGRPLWFNLVSAIIKDLTAETPPEVQKILKKYQ